MADPARTRRRLDETSTAPTSQAAEASAAGVNDPLLVRASVRWHRAVGAVAVADERRTVTEGAREPTLSGGAALSPDIDLAALDRRAHHLPPPARSSADQLRALAAAAHKLALRAPRFAANAIAKIKYALPAALNRQPAHGQVMRFTLLLPGGSKTLGVAAIIAFTGLLVPMVNGSFTTRNALALNAEKPVPIRAIVTREPAANPPQPATVAQPVVAQQQPPPRSDPEARMVRILMQVSAGDVRNALKDVDTLIAETPNFRLAHLVRGDLLLAHAHPLRTFGAVSDAPRHRGGHLPKGEFILARADSSQQLGAIGAVAAPPGVRELEEEARVRLRRYTETLALAELTPRYLLQLGSQQRHAIVVDTSRSRLLVYANREGDAPALIDDFYITIGKNGPEKNRSGDQRTPLGVYEITGDLAPERLTDFYGSGAFPINYPNAWDQRARRSGSGIWLHGVPSDTYSRPPRASNGCVVLSNSDLDSIRAYLKPGVTPVVIADNLEWANAESLDRTRAHLAANIEAWRKAWEERDNERYSQQYHESFYADGRDRSAWLAQKTGSNIGKSWISVRLSNLSMLGYPGNDKLAVVTFDQDYRSNNYETVARKRQYWLRDGEDWRIVYEGMD